MGCSNKCGYFVSLHRSTKWRRTCEGHLAETVIELSRQGEVRVEVQDFDICQHMTDAELKEFKGSPDEEWSLTLNKYQRDNILSVFNLIGYDCDKHVEPFHLLDTGDWVGEISLMLRKEQANCRLDKDDSPNKSVDEIEQEVEIWLKGKLGSMWSVPE